MRHSILPNLYLAQTAVMLSGARRVAMLLAVMMLTTTAQTAWADSAFSGGDGSSGNPYKIANTTDLNQLATDVKGGNGYSGKFFKLTANIEYDKNTENNFTPIGDYNTFYGTFDGDGKTISGININSDVQFQGIFGLVDGNVKNLVVSNCSIAGLQFIGVIAGVLRRGTIENCHVGNDVTLSSGNAYYAYAGGIVGRSERGTIKGCTCAATITSTTVARILGGIVGATTTSYPSTLTDNIFTGTITGNLGEYIGAIVGQNNNGTLTNNLYTSTGFGGIGAEGSTTGADGEGASRLTDWAIVTDGSADHPYIIYNKEHLDLLAQRVNAATNAAEQYQGKYFKLANDITYSHTTDWNDATSTENNFTPIGNDYMHSFKGYFDGNGKTISGIRIYKNNNEDARYLGLFGDISGGEVHDVILADTRITGKIYLGGIAGRSEDIISNCWVKDDVAIHAVLNESQYVGGIAGSNSSVIKGCRSSVTITQGDISVSLNFGGITGIQNNNPMGDCGLCNNLVVNATIPAVKSSDTYGAILGGFPTSVDLSSNIVNNYYIGCTVAGVENATNKGCNNADCNGARKALTISAATGVTITPTGAATTYDVSGITVYADNSCMGYGDKLYAGATDEVKLTLAYSGTAPEGYNLCYSDGSGNALTNTSGSSYTLTMPASDVTVDVDFDVIEYTLQYNGIDQATFVNSNPTTYTVESNAITLVNPTRTGYTFAGWTGTGLDAATMTVTIAKGSTGAKSYTATWKKLLTNTDIKVSAIADQTYTGSAFTPSVTVMDGETDITDQCDVAYSDNTNAGTATVTVTAKTAGNYSGEIKTTFNIVAKTVSTLTITLSATEYVYDGQAKEPAVSSVKVGDTVIPASEYTVAYENNTKAGTATVKIVDKDGGNYTVSGSATFEIVLMGDANGDKKVDAADIVEVVNYLNKKPSNRFNKKLANVTGSSDEVDEDDLKAIVNLVMGQ